MKTKWMHVLASIIALVLCISVATTAVQAAEVWGEDFESGMTEWTTFAFVDWGEGPTIAGNFSDAGGVRTALDDDVNYARHDSAYTVGTWSFDIYVPDTPNGYVGVAFMSNGTRPLEFASRVNIVEATTIGVDRFIFWVIRGASNSVAVDIYIPDDSIIGWHHIDVTRTSGGLFNFFFNGTFEYTSVTNDVTSSTYLEFFASNATGAALDNVNVSDTIDVTPPVTTPEPNPIPWDLIAIGGGAVFVVLIVIVILKRK